MLTPVGLALGVWLVLSSLVDPIDRLRRGITMTPAIVGMALAHAALGLFVISLTVVESYTAERDVAMAVGESAKVGDYEYRLLKVEPIQGANYDGVRGHVEVYRDGKLLACCIRRSASTGCSSR